MEEEKLKARKEQLETETQIITSTAKIKVLEECEYEASEDKNVAFQSFAPMSCYQ